MLVLAKALRPYLAGPRFWTGGNLWATLASYDRIAMGNSEPTTAELMEAILQLHGYVEAGLGALRQDAGILRHDMNRRFDRVDERFDRVDERFDRVDERFERVDERFERVDERFDSLDRRVARAEEST